MEIIRERLERECDLELVPPTPNVKYEISSATARRCWSTSPGRHAGAREHRGVPRSRSIRAIHLPARAHRRRLCSCARSARASRGQSYLPERARAGAYDLPLAEIVLDFFDKLEVAHAAATRRWTTSCSASASRDLVKLDMMLTGDKVDALSHDRPPRQGLQAGRALTEAPQADPAPTCSRWPSRRRSARRSSPAKPSSRMRKDVTAKCYGGDITRKRKLLEKQKAGKKRMKQVGRDRGPAGGVPGRPRAVRRRQLTRGAA